MHIYMDSKSRTNILEEDEPFDFLDALDEFPFYDCIDTADEPHQFISSSSSISHLQSKNSDDDVSIYSEQLPEGPFPAILHRRQPFSEHIHEDIPEDDLKCSKGPNLSVSSESTGISSERKYIFLRNLKKKQKDKSNLFEVGLSSEKPNTRLNEANKEDSTITTANNESIDDSVSIDSLSGEIDGSLWSYLFLFTGFVIKSIGFQISLLITFFTFPIWFLYCLYMFMVDPFSAIRRGREYLILKLFRIWGFIWENGTQFVYEWLKEHKSIWNLALSFGWGLLWSVYVWVVLVFLLIWAFATSGLMMNFLVEEPIQMKDPLDFDYTKSSPVAYVPIISCQGVPCSDYWEKFEVRKLGGAHVIPRDHKLQISVSVTLPESDYNRNLGMFQVRVDFLSADGKALASSSRPCMLHFRSEPLRLLLTFLKIAPLVAGYSSETQTLNVKFRGITEADIPTTCLRVIIEQRAEYHPGAGVPEIYAASLTLESELPLLKRILWYWKKTVFIWFSMCIFTMELVFTLLCCKPIIIPRVRLRNNSAGNGLL